MALAAATTPSSHNDDDDDDKAAARARSESAQPSRPAAVSLALDSSATTALPKGDKKLGKGMGSKVRAFFARPRRNAGAGACAGPVVQPKRRLSLPLPSLPRPRLSFLRKASA